MYCSIQVSGCLVTDVRDGKVKQVHGECKSAVCMLYVAYFCMALCREDDMHYPSALHLVLSESLRMSLRNKIYSQDRTQDQCLVN